MMYMSTGAKQAALSVLPLAPELAPELAPLEPKPLLLPLLLPLLAPLDPELDPSSCVDDPHATAMPTRVVKEKKPSMRARGLMGGQFTVLAGNWRIHARVLWVNVCRLRRNAQRKEHEIGRARLMARDRRVASVGVIWCGRSRFLGSRWMRRALLSVIVIVVVSFASAAHAQERPASTPETDDRTGTFGRITAGFGPGDLFFGQGDAARGFTRFSLGGDLGWHVNRVTGISAGFVAEHGKTSKGLGVTRAALGTTAEAWLGPIVLGAGLHFSWLGLERIRRPTDDSGLQQDALLWRLGVGPHAVALVRLPLGQGLDVHTGLRADFDAMLPFAGARDGVTPAPFWAGSVQLVAGITFD